VVRELAALGLNASTLQLLVSASEGYSSHHSEAEKSSHLQYEFEGIVLDAFRSLITPCYRNDQEVLPQNTADIR